MRKTLIIFMLILAVTQLTAIEAVVKDFKGKVEIKNQSGAWSPASIGTKVATGDFISTGFGSEAVLEMGKTIVQVKALTRMRLDELVEQQGTIKTDLFLDFGRVKADVKAAEGLGNDFVLRSPVSTAAVRGTSFEYSGYTLKVYEGFVLMINRINQRRLILRGEEVVLAAKNALPSSEDSKIEETQVSTNTSASAEDSGDDIPVREILGSDTVVSIKINWK